jgi:hypothetical protein
MTIASKNIFNESHAGRRVIKSCFAAYFYQNKIVLNWRVVLQFERRCSVPKENNLNIAIAFSIIKAPN